MAFDPLAWIASYGLTRIANKVFSPNLKRELLKEVHNWARDRLDSGALVPEALLPELDESDQHQYPKLTALYAKLSEPSVPAVEEWHAALVERHARIASTLPDPQPFFKQPSDTVNPLLKQLAARLHQVCAQDDRLFKIHVVESQQRMLKLLEESHRANANAFPASHTPIHHAVLQRLSEGLRGAGFKSVMEHMDREQAASGTLMFQWRLGSRSPHMMLVDRVGGVHVNRFSLILQEDSSIRVRVYDSAGQEHNVSSRPFEPGSQLICFVTWQNREMVLRVSGEQFGPLHFKPFEYLGPLTLFGIDIGGGLSADAVRWSVNEDAPGLCFKKDDVWHGSVWQQAALWTRVLSEDEQALFLDDPLVMFRRKDGSLALPDPRIGNIEVALSPEAECLAEIGGISIEEITSTVNDRHRGILIPGNPPLVGAVHWFAGHPILVIGEVSRHRKENEKLRIEQLICKLVLRLSSTLPAGKIDEWMKYGQILQVVAESFGVPVVCSKNGQPAKLHAEADWDGNVEIREMSQSAEVCVFGVFSPSEKKCRFVWAFSLEKYRDWLAGT